MRSSARARGYSAAWDKASKGFRRAHPLCQCPLCDEGRRRIRPSEVVDHRIPHKGDMARSEERRVGKVTGVQTCALPILPKKVVRARARGEPECARLPELGVIPPRGTRRARGSGGRTRFASALCAMRGEYASGHRKLLTIGYRTRATWRDRKSVG